MNIFTEFQQLSLGKILKLIGIALGGTILIAFVVLLASSTFRSISPSAREQSVSFNTSGAPAMMNGDSATESFDSSVGMPSLSARNVVADPRGRGIVGDDAEDFEVTQYSATYEARNFDEACGKVTALKQRDDVIFENANESDTACFYTFKVKREKVTEIVAVLQAMSPKTFIEDTYTIKRQLDDYTSEQEILEKKKLTIEETLASAMTAYNEITRLATDTRDAETLAKIIDSKVRVIERLTQERLAVAEQLERLGRAKAEQLDRLEFTSFSVSITEQKYIDAEHLSDSWRDATRQLVLDVNRALQGSTLKLITFLFFVLQYLVYVFVLLLLAKFVWRVAKRIWSPPPPTL